MKFPGIFIIIAFVLLSESVYASRFFNKNHLVFRLGYSLTNFSGKDVVNTTFLRTKDSEYFSQNPYQKTPRAGFTAGIGYNYRVSQNLSFQVEANYEEKGCKINLDSYQERGDFFQMDEISIFKINYLSIPILARYYPGEKRNLFFEGGAVYSHLLIVKETGEVLIEGELVSYQTADRFVNEEDIGIAIGTGVVINLSREKAISLGIRYTRSVISPGKIYIMEPEKVYNQFFSVGMTYYLSPGR